MKRNLIVFIQEIIYQNIKDGAYAINLDDFKPIGSHWIALHVNGNNRRASYDAIYFNNFWVEHIPK